jgi:hypothetical protein
MAEFLLDREASPSRTDLREDLLGAWVPDVAGWSDLDELLRSSWRGATPISQHLAVPRPEKPAMDIAVLHPGWHAALHQAVLESRVSIEQALAPTVFGYRYGADARAKYAHLWRQFRDYCQAMAEESGHVVITDVHRFFFSVGWNRVSDAVHRITGQPAHELETLGALLGADGLPHLPSGYSDARLLANAVLHHVDQQLAVPFARWVDDYRLFIPRDGDPQGEIDRLDRALRAIGLALNRPKTRILSGADAEAEAKDTLASVYHPERDSREEIHQSLDSRFEMAARDPIAYRRDLRFVISRLEREQDDVALEFALDGLHSIPWEAPRLISYIAVFSNRDLVASQIDTALRRAAQLRSEWLICRVGALACHTGISRSTARAMRRALSEVEGTPAWGMGLRLLALHGDRAFVSKRASGEVLDVRAALVALRDLNEEGDARLEESEPITTRVLQRGPADLPPVEAIL